VVVVVVVLLLVLVVLLLVLQLAALLALPLLIPLFNPQVRLLERVSSLTIDSCSDSLIVVGPAEDGVCVRECRNCELYLVSQQVRLLDCRLHCRLPAPPPCPPALPLTPAAGAVQVRLVDCVGCALYGLSVAPLSIEDCTALTVGEWRGGWAGLAFQTAAAGISYDQTQRNRITDVRALGSSDWAPAACSTAAERAAVTRAFGVGEAGGGGAAETIDGCAVKEASQPVAAAQAGAKSNLERRLAAKREKAAAAKRSADESDARGAEDEGQQLARDVDKQARARAEQTLAARRREAAAGLLGEEEQQQEARRAAREASAAALRAKFAAERGSSSDDD